MLIPKNAHTQHLDPAIYCLLRKEFLYDLEAHHGEHIKVCVFGAASLHGLALGFHVLTENGATFWRLPIHALCHRPDAPAMPLDVLQIWDCFSYDVSATGFDRLSEMRVRAYLKDRQWYPGRYLFTIDWYGSEDAEEAGEGRAKSAAPTSSASRWHGQLRGVPNNSLQWHDPAFVTPYTGSPTSASTPTPGTWDRTGSTTDEFF